MNLNDIRKVIEISDRANKTKTDLVEAVFGILVNENSTVSLQRFDVEWGEFVDVVISDLKDRDKVKVMIVENNSHTRKPRSYAEQCTPSTETSSTSFPVCGGGEKAVDRLIQNLEDQKSTLEYRLQLAQATLTSLKEKPRIRELLGQGAFRVRPTPKIPQEVRSCMPSSRRGAIARKMLRQPRPQSPN